jgi:hypothetical protein
MVPGSRFLFARRGLGVARQRTRLIATLVTFLLLCGGAVALPSVARGEAVAPACSGNAIVCENQLPGTPDSVWDVTDEGDKDIQGFSTQISVNVGQTVQFKIDTTARAYKIEIYRLGYYQGNGARKQADVTPSAVLPQVQPACTTDSATEIYDCGTWGFGIVERSCHGGFRRLHCAPHPYRQRRLLAHTVHRQRRLESLRRGVPDIGSDVAGIQHLWTV